MDDPQSQDQDSGPAAAGTAAIQTSTDSVGEDQQTTHSEGATLEPDGEEAEVLMEIESDPSTSTSTSSSDEQQQLSSEGIMEIQLDGNNEPMDEMMMEAGPSHSGKRVKVSRQT